MSHTSRPPVLPPDDLSVRLRHLALALMDAADLVEEDRWEEGRQAALRVTEQVRALVATA